MSAFGYDRRTSYLEIFQIGPPPATWNQNTYQYYPISVSAPFNPLATHNVALPGVSLCLSIWVDRAMRLPPGDGTAWVSGEGLRPNPIRPNIMHSTGVECRTEFTTIEKAIVATKVQVLYALGAPRAELEAMGATAGFAPADIVSYQYAADNREAFFDRVPDPTATPAYTWQAFRVCRDKIVLGIVRFIDSPNPKWGISLDYEAQDLRTEAQTLELVQWAAGQLHSRGLKLSFYTNPLETSTATANGLGPGNLNAIHLIADHTTILLGALYSVPDVYASFKLQMQALRGPNGDLPVDEDRLALTVTGEGPRHKAIETGFIFRRLLTDMTRVRKIWWWPDTWFMTDTGDVQGNRILGAAAFGYGVPAPLGRRA